MQVWLYESRKRRFTPADLAPATAENVGAARRTWLDEFQARRSLQIHDEDFMVWTHGVLSESFLADEPRPNGYVVLQSGAVQGVVVFDEKLQPSRLRTGSWLVYLHYLATAPWNRGSGGTPGHFRRVGKNLVVQAVRESIHLGCPGRVGLHSFGSAGEFYEKLCFDNVGSDPSKRGMCYFELRPSAAFALLSETEVPPNSPLDRARLDDSTRTPMERFFC